MRHCTIRDALASKEDLHQPVTVQGWVRTRRDSKAGLSFIQLSDGSSHEPLQIVADNGLPNYEAEILHLTTGCAITREWKPRRIPGQGSECRTPGCSDRGGRLG